VAVIDAEKLNAYMGTPEWSQSQWAEAEDLCVTKEGDLAALLNCPISPEGPYAEVATVLDSGLVATTYPVYSVSSFQGVVLAGGVLPAGWELTRHRVRRAQSATAPLLTTSASLLGGPFGGFADRLKGQGAVAITYLAGWGDIPALRGAILTKAAAVMTNRHDETMRVTNLDAAGPQPLREEWNAADLAKLGIYRNLVVVR
jgi:hypothetical protein